MEVKDNKSKIEEALELALSILMQHGHRYKNDSSFEAAIVLEHAVRRMRCCYFCRKRNIVHCFDRDHCSLGWEKSRECKENSYSEWDLIDEKE